MKKEDLKQKMMTCIVTLEKLTGRIPKVEELFNALGKEYEGVLTEYCRANGMLALA